MSTRTLPGGTRRWITAGAMVALVITTATGCFGTWGVRSSFRTYVAGTAGGTITADQGATWLDGAGPGQGPFQWTVAHAQLDPGTETGYIQFSGIATMQAHAVADGYALDLSLVNPRLELDGDTGTLVTDLNYRAYTGTSPGTLAPLQAALDVDFATVDLAGFDWTLTDDTYTITDAPVTGITATMELIGFDEFYGDPVTLDPFSVSFNATTFAPTMVEAPRITVSKTSGLHFGDQIIVTGQGFAPNANIGTRPPLSGQPSGAYVVWGKFADTWQPSAGAPSSARKTITQQWALPEPSYTAMVSFPGVVRTDATGTFEAAFTLNAESPAVATGNYGIYVYPGSGATNATYELQTLLGIS